MRRSVWHPRSIERVCILSTFSSIFENHILSLLPRTDQTDGNFRMVFDERNEILCCHREFYETLETTGRRFPPWYVFVFHFSIFFTDADGNLLLCVQYIKLRDVPGMKPVDLRCIL